MSHITGMPDSHNPGLPCDVSQAECDGPIDTSTDDADAVADLAERFAEAHVDDLRDMLIELDGGASLEAATSYLRMAWAQYRDQGQ
jgi:hypothetical protein